MLVPESFPRKLVLVCKNPATLPSLLLKPFLNMRLNFLLLQPCAHSYHEAHHVFYFYIIQSLASVFPSISSIEQWLPLACACCSRFCHVQLYADPGTVAHQAPPSMGFFRKEYWSGLPCPPLGDLPDPGIEPMSPALVSGFFPNASWEPAASRVGAKSLPYGIPRILHSTGCPQHSKEPCDTG